MKNKIFLYNFAWTDVSELWTLLAKIQYFFHYTSTDANALICWQKKKC